MRPLLDPALKNGSSLPLLNHINSNIAEFEIFFKENFSGLCAYCQFKFGFDLDLAKEATHAGFVKLWESRDSIAPNLSVKPYLYKIITNICFDILRHEKVKQKHEKHVLKTSYQNQHGQFDSTEFNELRNRVNAAVSELPEQMRKIFELSRYEGLKYAEIAAKLAISVKTVETQMGRALVKLRQKLADYLPVGISIMFLLP